MKTWENWPYWFKGGVMISAVVIIISIPILIDNSIVQQQEGGLLHSLLKIMGPLTLIGNGLISFIPSIIITDEGMFRQTELGALPTPSGVLLNIVFTFIAGALFGWLYGKIKTRKSSATSQN